MLAALLWEAMLWGAVLVLAYIYAGYPVLAVAIARLRPNPVRKGPSIPTVTAIISVSRTQRIMRRRLPSAVGRVLPVLGRSVRGRRACGCAGRGG